jgi:serine protease Do
MKRLIVAVVLVFVACNSAAATPIAALPASLTATSATIETLVRQVGRSVVQVVVTGYRPGDDGGDVLVASRSIGSGAVVAAGGLIVTNAHVVVGAEQIHVVLPDAAGDDVPLAHRRARTLAADLVGVAPQLDLALLHVDADLPALPIASADAVHQGELVFAFGSPAGLRNSVSMGLVSAVARQVDSSSPIAYIQTDSAINPGNSGGPLVDAQGQLVGLNTFIRSESGGSEGLGFAIPAAIVALALPQLRDYGHLHRATLGVAVQQITPLLREGLGIADDVGLIVADVPASGPAAAAGVQAGDGIASLDGHEVSSLSFVALYHYLYGLSGGEDVVLGIRRGNAAVTVTVKATAEPHRCERPTTLANIEDAIVEPLGIVVATGDEDPPGAVTVAARVSTGQSGDVALAAGDIIRSINNVPVTDAASMRGALDRIPHGHAVVLQVERNGGLTYIAFER